MDKRLIVNRFHVYSGFKKDGELAHAHHVGEAYEMESSKPCYVLKLWAFPNNTFYLCANKAQNGRYTLFAKMLGDFKDPTFRRPVGFGNLTFDLRNYLEVQFNFPRQKLFLSLYPAQTSVDSLFSQSEEGEV